MMPFLLILVEIDSQTQREVKNGGKWKFERCQFIQIRCLCGSISWKEAVLSVEWFRMDIKSRNNMHLTGAAAVQPVSPGYRSKNCLVVLKLLSIQQTG